jgi:adenylate cyclase
MNNSRNRSSEAVLAKYFDPYLLQLLQNPAILELKDSCLTTVFWDISNFSRLCNKLMKNPEAVTAFLKEYFNEAMDIIRSHRGILDKFIGDGILAYFGYIDDAPDCGAFNATMAAIELRERFKQIKSKWSQIWADDYKVNVSIDIKCGIHSGDILFGILSGTRDQITGIGREVNFASRLEGIAKKNEIITSIETKKKLEHRFDFNQLLPNHPIKKYVLRKRIKSFERVKIVFKIN